MKQHEHIPLEEAQRRLLAELSAPKGRELVPLWGAPGRVLAEEVRASIDLPPFHRSPLDGYAVRAADLATARPDHPIALAVTGRACAGDPPPGPIGPGESARVMTGAPLPEGADTVVRQEDTDLGEERVHIFQTQHPHQNFCFRGEEVRAGDALIPLGTRLDWTHMGALAAQGRTDVSVYPRPRVAVLSTGSELAPAGGVLGPGRIYDSNGPLLCARLAALGAEPVPVPATGDALEGLIGRVSAAARDCALVLTTGGVSVGQRDLMPLVAESLGGRVLFHGVEAKPGTPTLGFLAAGTPILALSGNPFAALAIFEVLGRPLVEWLCGRSGTFPQQRSAVLDGDFPKASPTRRLVRARLEGNRVLLPGVGHASGMVTGLMGCNCLIDLPAGSAAPRQGERVAVLLLD